MNIDALYLTPLVLTSKLQFQNTLSAIATLFPICYLIATETLTCRYKHDCLIRKAQEAHFLHKAKTIESLGMRNVTSYNHYVIFIFFTPLFFSATPYHVIPCNFHLLFYSSIYSVKLWLFLINLMKTGISQSKYCKSQPFSCCFISLCSSLFNINSIFIFFD